MMTMMTGDSPGAIIARKMRHSDSSSAEQMRLETKMMGGASPFPIPEIPLSPRAQNGIIAEVRLCVRLCRERAAAEHRHALLFQAHRSTEDCQSLGG